MAGVANTSNFRRRVRLPQRIVAAYVSALDAHDIATARALLTPAHARVVQGAVDSWFGNVVSIKHLQMNEPFKDPLAARQLHYNYCVGMGVDFALEQHQVMSMPNGPTVWGTRSVATAAASAGASPTRAPAS